MRIGPHDPAVRAVIIAEVGNNHEGDEATAVRMIDAAADAGADAVKFQAIVPERLVNGSQRERLAQLGRICLPLDAFARLAAAAHRRGVAFLCTPFCEEAVAALEPLVPAWKIASGDVDHEPLLRCCAATAKPVILSTGACDLAGVQRSVTFLRTHGASAVALLHCVLAYPAPEHAMNLRAIRTLEPLADAIGWSDHALGTDVAVAAVAAGARIVEKHFTLDKSRTTFRDHALSADPQDFRTMVDRIRAVERWLGDDRKHPTDAESGAAAARRGAYATRDLAAGTILREEDIAWLRPSTGVTPRDLRRLLAAPLTRAVAMHEAIPDPGV